MYAENRALSPSDSAFYCVYNIVIHTKIGYNGYSRKKRYKLMENETQVLQLLIGISEKLDKIENRITAVEVYQENVLLSMIKLVAENHIDLTRKLDTAIDSQFERDMMKMHIKSMESDIKKLKMQ